jgi:hypothetical protein
MGFLWNRPVSIIDTNSNFTGKFVVSEGLYVRVADESLDFPMFLSAAQPKEFFLDGLKKLEQRSHKCVELMGRIYIVTTFI